MWYSQTVLFYWETTFSSFASWILSPLSTRRKEMCGHYYYLESGLCEQLTAHCTIANTGCPHGACKDTQLAQWQRSFAENLGQGGRSTQCPLTNSTDPASVKQHKHCATSTHILPLKLQDIYYGGYLRYSATAATSLMCAFKRTSFCNVKEDPKPCAKGKNSKRSPNVVITCKPHPKQACKASSWRKLVKTLKVCNRYTGENPNHQHKHWEALHN